MGDLTAAVEPAAAAEPAWKVLARQEAGWRADAAPGEPGSGMHALTPTTRPFAKDAFNVRFGGVNVGRITRSDGRHKWAATLIDTHGEIVDWAPDHKDFDKAVAGLMTAVAARVRDERERS